MRKLIDEKDTKLIRVKLRTARLLDGMAKKSYDEAIWYIWRKLCARQEKINAEKKESIFSSGKEEKKEKAEINQV